MSRLRRTLPTLALGAGLAMFGCGDKGGKGGEAKGSPEPAAKGSAARAEGGAATPQRAAETPVFTKAKVLEAIPADAPLVFVTTDFTEIMKQLGRDGVLAAFPEEAAELKREMARTYGEHDLLDPAAWAAVGLDAKAPMAVAILGFDDESVATYMRLSDGAKFDAFVGPILDNAEAPKAEDGGKLRPMKAEEGEYVYSRSYLIRKGDLAITLYTHKPKEEARAQARQLIALTPEKSVSANASARGAFDALAFGEHGNVWVNIPALLPASGPTPYAGVADAEAELKAAEASGDAGRIERARRNMEQARQLQKLMDESRARAREVLGAVFSGLRGLAVGVTASGPVIGLKGSLEMTRESPLRGVFSAAEGPARLVQALDTQPILLSNGHVSFEGLEAYIEGLLRASGERFSLTQGKGMLMAMTGLNIDLVLGQLTGEMGFAVTFDAAQMTTDASPKAFGGAALVGLKDPKAFLDALAPVINTPAVTEVVKRNDEGMWEIPVPEYGPLYIGVVGDYLAASPDKAFLDRVKANDASKSFTHGIQSADLKGTLSASGATKVWLSDMALFGLMLWADTFDWERPSPYMDQPTPEFLAKQKEYDALTSSLKAQRKADRAAVRDKLLEIMKIVGIQAGHARLTERGLQISGGQYLGAPDLAGAFLAVLKQAKGIDALERAQRDARRPDEQRKSALRRELEQLAR